MVSNSAVVAVSQPIELDVLVSLGLSEGAPVQPTACRLHADGSVTADYQDDPSETYESVSVFEAAHEWPEGAGLEWDRDLDSVALRVLGATGISVEAVEADGQEAVWVRATVAGLSVSLHAVPRETAAGRSGVDPSGDGWLDERLVARFGAQANRVGREILAHVKM